MKPKQLSKDQLRATLQRMQDAVTADDSFGGSLEYEANEQGTFDVRASFRVGNSQGQGGVILIGDE